MGRCRCGGPSRVVEPSTHQLPPSTQNGGAHIWGGRWMVEGGRFLWFCPYLLTLNSVTPHRAGSTGGSAFHESIECDPSERYRSTYSPAGSRITSSWRRFFFAPP